jgi:H+/Cl- antiporter ClcA
MIKKWLQAFDQYYIFKYLIKWFFLTIPVSLAVGSAVALFLWLLDLATQFRWAHSWLLYLLPFAGVAIVALYKTKGKNTDAGTNLVMDEIHKPGGGIPFRMAPFVLITTVVTHLFGGSAGREGTAVQIGGSMAHYLGKIMKLSKEDLSILLTTGVAAGFGAVFGTPVAGAIFAIEVITIGHLKYNALLPSLLAAISADFICNLYGTQHTHYLINFDQQVSTFELFNMSFDYKIIIWVVIASVIFGIAGNVFSELSHATKAFFKKYVKNYYLIPVIGGLTIIILAYVPLHFA